MSSDRSVEDESSNNAQKLQLPKPPAETNSYYNAQQSSSLSSGVPPPPANSQNPPVYTYGQSVPSTRVEYPFYPPPAGPYPTAEYPFYPPYPQSYGNAAQPMPTGYYTYPPAMPPVPFGQYYGQDPTPIGRSVDGNNQPSIDEIFQIRDEEGTIPNMIFISNLPSSTTNDQLHEEFSKAGNIRKIPGDGKSKIWIYKDRVKEKGFAEATVCFQDANAAQEAIKMFNGSTVFGQAMTIELCSKKELNNQVRARIDIAIASGRAILPNGEPYDPNSSWNYPAYGYGQDNFYEREPYRGKNLYRERGIAYGGYRSYPNSGPMRTSRGRESYNPY
ncbi:hypothetical protein ACOME3_008284 [Neoechinorhynchus agilis]